MQQRFNDEFRPLRGAALLIASVAYLAAVAGLIATIFAR